MSSILSHSSHTLKRKTEEEKQSKSVYQSTKALYFERRMNFEPKVPDYGMQHPNRILALSMANPPLELNHHLRHYSSTLQSLYPFNLSDEETLFGIGYSNKQERLTNEVAIEPQQIEDLSAVVEKCNSKGFLNPSFCFRPTDRSISDISALPSFPNIEDSGLISCSQYSNERIHKPHGDGEIKSKRIVRQIHSSKGSRSNGGEQEEYLKLKRCGTNDCSFSQLKKRSVLSERLRRNQMVELFAKLRSLLPYPTLKRDRSSIVSAAISYIKYLRYRLAIHSKKEACTTLVEVAGNIPDKESLLQMDRSQFFLSNKSKSILGTEYCDENLTLNSSGKDIFITFNCVKKTNLLPAIILVIEAHKMEVMNIFISHLNTVAFHYLHVKALEILGPDERETLHGILIKLMKSELQIN